MCIYVFMYLKSNGVCFGKILCLQILVAEIYFLCQWTNERWYFTSLCSLPCLCP